MKNLDSTNHSTTHNSNRDSTNGKIIGNIQNGREENQLQSDTGIR